MTTFERWRPGEQVTPETTTRQTWFPVRLWRWVRAAAAVAVGLTLVLVACVAEAAAMGGAEGEGGRFTV